MLDAVARFRRFSRAVTSEVGALDSSFLGRGRPLGAARVLNAIGNGFQEVADIRDYLALDSGLMSRLLRGLEDEGLVQTIPAPGDRRRRVAILSDAGRQEFLAYERISDERASALIRRSRCADELLKAMDLCATTLKRDLIEVVEVDPNTEEARYCLQEYYLELQRRFSNGFELSRSRNPDAADIIRPRGAFLVALSDGMPIGCVALKGTGDGVAEIKRLWVSPSARGLGTATRLMDAAEAAARELSLTLLRLDTNRDLPEAIAMYQKSGWTEIERFNDDPYADHFFEKRL